MKAKESRKPFVDIKQVAAIADDRDDEITATTCLPRRKAQVWATTPTDGRGLLFI